MSATATPAPAASPTPAPVPPTDIKATGGAGWIIAGLALGILAAVVTYVVLQRQAAKAREQ